MLSYIIVMIERQYIEVHMNNIFADRMIDVLRSFIREILKVALGQILSHLQVVYLIESCFLSKNSLMQQTKYLKFMEMTYFNIAIPKAT